MRALAFVRDDHVRGGEHAVKRRRDELLHYWRVSDKFAVPSTIPVERGGARGAMHAFRRVRPCHVMFGSPSGTNSSHHHGFPARLADCSVRNWAAEPLEVNKACWAWCPGTLSMALSMALPLSSIGVVRRIFLISLDLSFVERTVRTSIAVGLDSLGK